MMKFGIWCHAERFARKEGLHGLFSGMIVSDENEAQEYGVPAMQQHIEEENEIMFGKLRRLLDEECPLCDIPQRMKELNDRHHPIADFNYSHFYYM